MTAPAEILSELFAKAEALGATPAISDDEVLGRIKFVCRCLQNRAGVRLLMSCMLAKLDRPNIDPRKPYTEIGDDDCFSGRTYDEQFLSGLISSRRLPCNSTTAFLTPALRNHNSTLVTSTTLVGRPPQLYRDTIQLLEDVAQERASAVDVLTDAIRILIMIRNEKDGRMKELTAALQHSDEALPLSAEDIVILLQQHLACKHSSRLPVLMVAAAYEAATEQLGQKARALKGHLSADQQSGAVGDIEICLINEDRIATVYEMKSKRVTQSDIDRAMQKVASGTEHIDNYIFITTDPIEVKVSKYAGAMYEQTHGIEIAILDCIGFIRHFLHLFHRLRINFLNAYQQLVLVEPDSAVNQPLKEAFLTLRQAAESDE